MFDLFLLIFLRSEAHTSVADSPPETKPEEKVTSEFLRIYVSRLEVGGVGDGGWLPRQRQEMRTYIFPPPPCRCPFSHAPSSPDPELRYRGHAGCRRRDQGPEKGDVGREDDINVTSWRALVSTKKRPQAAFPRAQSSTGVGRARRSDPGGGRAQEHLGRGTSPNSAQNTPSNQAPPLARSPARPRPKKN